VTEGAVQLIVILLPVLALVVVALVNAVQVIPQATAGVIERLGRYKTTAGAGTVFLVPFVDKVRERVDLREQVVSFAPQPVITKDGLTVDIDTAVSFQVVDPKAAVYEISDYVAGVEQLTTMALRDVIGGVSLGDALTSGFRIATVVRGEMDEAVRRWGLRVWRVEINGIEPRPQDQDKLGGNRREPVREDPHR
jgi:regulator of protease activity HflC (stomatin/prohibitin superfamily)